MSILTDDYKRPHIMRHKNIAFRFLPQGKVIVIAYDSKN